MCTTAQPALRDANTVSKRVKAGEKEKTFDDRWRLMGKGVGRWRSIRLHGVEEAQSLLDAELVFR